jgi:hypothetical protein
MLIFFLSCAPFFSIAGQPYFSTSPWATRSNFDSGGTGIVRLSFLTSNVTDYNDVESPTLQIRLSHASFPPTADCYPIVATSGDLPSLSSCQFTLTEGAVIQFSNRLSPGRKYSFSIIVTQGLSRLPDPSGTRNTFTMDLRDASTLLRVSLSELRPRLI